MTDIRMNNEVHIETQRLLIRRFHTEDWHDLYEYLSQPETVYYEPYDVYTEETAMLEAINRSRSNDFYAVCIRDTGKLIGNVYLHPQEFFTYEIGYIFNSKYWQQGYASEAVRAVITNTIKESQVHRFVAHCNPENAASWYLLEKVGFRREGYFLQNIYFRTDVNGNYIWQDTYEYGILTSEWLDE